MEQLMIPEKLQCVLQVSMISTQQLRLNWLLDMESDIPKMYVLTPDAVLFIIVQNMLATLYETVFLAMVFTRIMGPNKVEWVRLLWSHWEMENCIWNHSLSDRYTCREWPGHKHQNILHSSWNYLGSKILSEQSFHQEKIWKHAHCSANGSLMKIHPRWVPSRFINHKHYNNLIFTHKKKNEWIFPDEIECIKCTWNNYKYSLRLL